ncbi:MAG TPA: twin-arginine translocase TatA/TatE family subunit [Candidatus Cryptobacteroides merdipullorum]|uniref:Sec-independent protein translocase protein TatA n=1 Tax=Candidatus Cryptobacteroides merdipullorum TaxID=2840771 RepID=A0A9D1GR88_9BACT|nr:twin-arginine translocase TatA/TatE family subunit [Candidatus Cryptobacteroides merdipullorum]
MIGVWEIVAIVFVIVLLVGGKKIPELMKGVGKGVKSFKEGLNGIEEDVKRSGTSPKDSADSGAKDGASGDKTAE